MKTVGSILRETRLEKRLTLEQVEASTKIRRKFLEAIESDDYSTLPSVAYAKGFVKNYSDFLGLKSTTTLAFFRRQTKDASKSSLLPSALPEALQNRLLRLTPARFLGLLLVGLLGIFLFYFVIQYQRLKEAPILTVETPAVGLVTREHRIDILGSTNPDATVYVNGVSVLVRDDGKFFDQISVTPGIQKVTITATSRFGKTTSVVREVAVEE